MRPLRQTLLPNSGARHSLLLLLPKEDCAIRIPQAMLPAGYTVLMRGWTAGELLQARVI